MKKSLVTTCLSILFITAFISCKRNTIVGDGPSGSVSRDVASFSRVDVSTEIEVIIHVDATATPSVVLEGYKNVISNIKTEVQNNTLRIYTAPRLRIDSDKDIVATITVPSLTFLGLSGESDAHVKGNLAVDNLELRISGIGNMHVESMTQVNNLKLSISGAGNMEMDHITVNKFDAGLTGVGDLKIHGGTASDAHMTISGAGEIDADNLVCKTAKVKVSGIGGMSVNVEENMDVHISGAGDVKYKGHPAVTKHVSGIGDIEDNN